MNGNIKFNNSSLSPKDRAELDNMNADMAVNADRDEYSKIVNRLIRRRYTESEESAIKSHVINNILNDDPNISEWIEFNKYRELCKLEAKEELLKNKNSEMLKEEI